MKKKVLDKLTNFIKNNKECSEKDLKIYRYGLETIYNMITKTIVVLLITYFLGTIKQCFLLILFYTSVRLFSYGLHASSSLGCWLTTIPIYISGSYFIKLCSVNKYYIFAALLIYTIFAILWAPADTKKKPIIRRERRIKLKVLSIIVCISHAFIIYYASNQYILNAILFSLVLQSICICPLTYKITNNRFNNYLYYQKKMV